MRLNKFNAQQVTLDASQFNTSLKITHAIEQLIARQFILNDSKFNRPLQFGHAVEQSYRSAKHTHSVLSIEALSVPRANPSYALGFWIE